MPLSAAISRLNGSAPASAPRQLTADVIAAALVRGLTTCRRCGCASGGRRRSIAKRMVLLLYMCRMRVPIGPGRVEAGLESRSPVGAQGQVVDLDAAVPVGRACVRWR